MAKQLSKNEEQAYKQWLELCKQIDAHDAPIPEESEIEKRKRIERLNKKGNAAEYNKYYFGHYIDSEFAWFQEEIDDAYDNNDNIFLVAEVPREHAKSVFIIVFKQIRLLTQKRLDGLIVAGRTDPKAKKLIGDIEAELRKNKRLIADYGDFNIMGTHREGYFSINGDIGVWAFSPEQEPAGVRESAKRPNSGVCDDMDSLKKYHKKPDRVETDIQWIMGEFMNCLSLKNKFFAFCNNRVCEDGLTAHMVGDVKDGDPKRKGIIHIKAYATEDPKTHKKLLIEEGGVPSWSRYTIEMLQARFDEIGPSATQRQFYHTHKRVGKFFLAEKLPWVTPLPWVSYDALIEYLDPAYGNSGKSCYRALILLGKIGLRYHVLFAWMRTKGDFPEAQRALEKEVQKRIGSSGKEIVTNNARFKISKFQNWVEAGSLQRTRLDNIYKLADLERGSVWRPRYDDESLGDKIANIESLDQLVDKELLGFSSEFQKNEDMIILRNQFIDFPNDFYDGPDCVYRAKNKIDKLTKKGQSESRTGNFTKNSNRSLI